MNASFKLVALVALALTSACHSDLSRTAPNSPKRDINAVLADHDDQLMAKPGVVGVYVGLLDDGKTQCLKVMLKQQDRDLERSIPRTLEGYPVVIEISGEIRPLGKP